MNKSRNIFSLLAGGVELLTGAFDPIERREHKKGQYLINTRKYLAHGFETARREAEESGARKFELIGNSD